ncbi:MAG TPA: hypothetical protein VLX92_28945 [Kofleriaceae bacterium]|nr:hypothetical protein [Kofleriaceae bacterium]
MMTRLVAIAIALAGCGRLDFDLIGGGSGSGASDARRGDGKASPPGDGTRPADAASTACDHAIPVTAGTPLTESTCTGRDQVEGCGPAGTQEVVFAFTAPDDNGYTFRAFDPGTMNVSNSTGVLDATCTTVQSCSGIYGDSPGQGNTIYLVVEASSGGCATIEFSVM